MFISIFRRGLVGVEEEEWEEEAWVWVEDGEEAWVWVEDGVEEWVWVEDGVEEWVWVEELDTLDGAWVGQEEEFSTTLHISKITTRLMYTFIRRRLLM
jgi:hypothetical protein